VSVVSSACLLSVVRLVVATRSSGPPASGKIIKEMPGSVASGTPYIKTYLKIHTERACNVFVLTKGRGVCSSANGNELSGSTVRGGFPQSVKIVTARS
jgi:hypothetical protein